MNMDNLDFHDRLVDVSNELKGQSREALVSALPEAARRLRQLHDDVENARTKGAKVMPAESMRWLITIAEDSVFSPQSFQRNVLCCLLDNYAKEVLGSAD